MSAVLQVRIRDSEATSAPKPEMVVASPSPAQDNTLQLLRDAIARLNAPTAELPDQTQMADLLLEVREALERANVITRTATLSEEFARQGQFDKALRALDDGLAAYPNDPALISRRADVEQRQRASQSAATVQTALAEAQWLVDQDRLDLAARFLKEKASDLPDQPALTARLEEIETLLPQWVEDRKVQSALGRVAALEDLQQWQVALAIVEEALHSHSASAELADEARRIRDRLADQERQNRLSRRLELIGQKISAQAWKQAATILQSTQKDFPGAPELEALRREVDAGLKRSECEGVVTEARQCLADGELEQAEKILRRGLESLGREPALEALHKEIESEKKVRDELRKAQILFGRRQLAEAERVLNGLVDANLPESRVLLDAVRKARAETEEENFCERGREKALKMMQQQQFAQAIDLLRNLRSLFPDNPILERDLAAAQSALRIETPEIVPGAEKQEHQPNVPDPIAPQFAMLGPRAGTNVLSSSSGARRLAIAGAAAMVLIAAGGAAWKLSRNGAPEHQTSTAPRIAPAPVTAPTLPTASVPVDGANVPQSAETSRKAPPKPSPIPAPEPAAAASVNHDVSNPQPEITAKRVVKPFVTAAKKETAVRSPVVPLPPDLVVSADLVASLPAGLVGSINASAPTATPAPVTASKAASVASGFQPAQVVNRTLPTYPPLALQLRTTGVVRVEAIVDEHGIVKSVKAVSGNPLLAASALDAVRKWKYKPATLNGQPVLSSAIVQLEFQKDDAGK